MKISTVFLWLLIYCPMIAGQAAGRDSISAPAAPPVLLEKGAGLSYAMTEIEYLKLMKQLSGRPNYIEIRSKPRNLSKESRFGMNIVVNGKNIGWALDGNEKRGFMFYADWNADGYLTDDEAVKLKKTAGKYAYLFTRTLTETIDKQARAYRFDLKIEVAMIEPPGETVKKLAIKSYDSTVRRGELNVGGRRIGFELVGTAGFYNTEYNNLYFDLNGDGRIDDKFYAAEKYKVAEKYINIGETTYEFSVDRYGESLTLKPRAEKLPARVELSPGNAAPEISFTDLDGRPHRLSDFRGRVVLLDFWGLWCAPCVAEAPKLAAFHQKMRDKGFEVVSFDNGDTVENLRKFIGRTQMNWTHAQVDDALRKLYRIDRYPTYFLLDKDGKIISNSLRPGADLYKKVEELLGAPAGLLQNSINASGRTGFTPAR